MQDLKPHQAAELVNMRVRFTITGFLNGAPYSHSGNFVSSDKTARRAVRERCAACLALGLVVRLECIHIFDDSEDVPEEI